MNSDAFALAAFRSNAKVIGNEVAWRGTDIVEVLKEIGGFGVAVVGVESVEFPCADGRPMVISISDSVNNVKKWKQSLAWEDCVARSRSRTLEDIERNVKEPYGANVWYLVYGERSDGAVLTADP